MIEDRDTISDDVPKREHVLRRLEYIHEGSEPLDEASLKVFLDYIPTNHYLASLLMKARDRVKDDGKEVNPESILESLNEEGIIKTK